MVHHCNNHEFGGALYANEAEMCDAIAESFLLAGGANGKATAQEYLENLTDAELADLCIMNWFTAPGMQTFGTESLENSFKSLRDPMNFESLTSV